MGRDDVLKILDANLAELRRRFGITSLRIFGSVARDEASADSDVDILVGYAEPPSFLEFMRLKGHLEDILGAKVDLITESGLKERARPSVEKDAIRVA
jgi:predicted nucleotidyltransferase